MPSRDIKLEDVSLRDVVLADLDAISDIIARSWNQDIPGREGFLASREEVLAHLLYSSWAKTAIFSGKPVGTMMARWHEAEPPNASLWRAQRELNHQAATRALIDLDSALDVVVASAQLMREVETKRGSTDVGELELLAISEEVRGIGLGRYLLTEGIRYLHNCGAKRFRLATDDSCNWQIYEHLNMQRVGESVCATAHSDSLNIYIYEGETKDYL